MAYINGTGMISPQKIAGNQGFPEELTGHETEFLKCIEPTYREFIDPLASRRMSRLIKMGVTAAQMSIRDAGIDMPDAIITGTGLGSVEDTEKILAGITQDERFLNPTPFIQSTYNTISSQIAIHLKCLNYNSTYVHRTFSFESGLMDGLLQLEEGIASDILVGGIDEMTMNHLKITRRIGLWKMQPVHNLQLKNHPAPGALAGEGATFFTIGNRPGNNVYARIEDVQTWININGSFDPGRILPEFLEENGRRPADIDLLLLGYNGDPVYDPVYREFAESLFADTAQGWYKHLCGEYHTASGFGLRTAACILRDQYYPEFLNYNNIQPQNLKNILIYNHFRNVNHSMILISKC